MSLKEIFFCKERTFTLNVILFDHKGSLIFLVNAIGYMIYPRSGIMVPQVMFFTSYSKQAEVSNVHERENLLRLKALIPDDERNSFVCWGDTCTGAHWILQTGIKPRNRFFTNVRWMAKADLSLRDEWFDDVRCYPPLWILYGTDPNRKTGAPLSWTEDTELEKLLAEKYSLKGEVFIYPQMMKLYKLKG